MAKNFLQDVKARYARIQISETEVSEDNVRKTGQYENLEELKNSIRKFGLLHAASFCYSSNRKFNSLHY